MSATIVSQSTRNFTKDVDDLDMNWGANAVTASLLQGNAALNVYYTASLVMSKPTAVQLTSLIPEATTGSLYLVGSGSETWITFKDLKGSWRTVSASHAA